MNGTALAAAAIVAIAFEGCVGGERTGSQRAAAVSPSASTSPRSSTSGSPSPRASRRTPVPPNWQEPGATYVPIDASLEAMLPAEVHGVLYMVFSMHGEQQGCYDIMALGFCHGQIDALAKRTGVAASAITVAAGWPTSEGSSVLIRAVRVPHSKVDLLAAWTALNVEDLHGYDLAITRVMRGGKQVTHLQPPEPRSYDDDEYVYVHEDVIFVVVDVPSKPAGGTFEPPCPACVEDAFAQLP